MYTILYLSNRICIVDNTSNVIGLLSPKETAAFEKQWLEINKLKKWGFSRFYNQKIERMCQIFTEAA